MFEHDGTEYPATITVAQTSRITGLSIRATYRAVEAGHIPHVRFGDRILVLTAKLFELLGLNAATPSTVDETPPAARPLRSVGQAETHPQAR